MAGMRSALVTGANRGIGLGLVTRLVKSKSPAWNVFATCRKPDQAEELQELVKCHDNIHVLPFDLTNFESYSDLAKEVSSVVRDRGLNLLVNNAGIPGRYATVSYFKAADLIETFTVNTAAPIMLTKAFIPLLKAASRNNKNLPMGVTRAAVVNMSSILGSIKQNTEGGYYLYRCSKSALNAATKSFSVDLKLSNILVTCLHPGWVKTKMGGPHAPMSVEEACDCIIPFFHSLTEKHNGGFYTYEGLQLEW